MTPTDRRDRITAVFQLAIKLESEERQSFLERECHGDSTLIAEVKSLLSDHQRTEETFAARNRTSRGSGDRGMPRRIGRYEITGALGSGGFGHVYSALDPGVGRVVAIKVLNAPDDPDVVNRFRVEAVTVANLHHKNIVTVHEFGEENGAPYLVMEFLEGTSLQDLIRQRAPLSIQEKVWIMSEVAEALQHAHARGITHRDVKPANIMRLVDGSVKIMDFGIARLAKQTSTRLTQAGLVIGTLMYMAPEQFNDIADALSDIFAYGVTFYELLAGRHPFASKDPGAVMYRIANTEPDSLRSLVSDCPDSIERLVTRLLAKRREGRYQSLADVVVDMKPVLLDLSRKQAGDLFTRAGNQFGDKQLDAAQLSVRKALELDPWHTEARQLRSKIEYAVQRRDAVDRANSLLDRAEQELSHRAYDEASECLSSVEGMGLDDERVKKRLEKGRALIAQAANAGRLLDAARAELQNENLTDAIRSVSEVLAADPANATGQQLLQAIRARVSSREAKRKIEKAVSHAESLLLLKETDQALELIADLELQEPDDRRLAELRRKAELQKGEEVRARRFREGIASIRSSLKQGQLSAVAAAIDAMLAEFPGNSELLALQGHAADQIATRRRAEDSARLKVDAAAWIQERDYDRAIRALEAGVAQLGDDGDLTRLLQSAIEGKAALERDQSIARIDGQTRRLLQEGKLDDAARAVERAIQRWGHEASLVDLMQQISQERQQKERRRRLRECLRQAKTLLSQNRPDAVVTLITQTIERDGEEPELRQLLEEAESQLRLHSRSASVASIREDAQKLSQEKRWREALRKLEDGLKTFPGDSSLTLDRGRVAEQIAAESREQIIEAALASARELQRSNRVPEAAQLLENRVADLGADSRLMAARQSLAPALAEIERTGQIRAALAECENLLAAGQFDEAIRRAEGCEVRYPENSDAAVFLARARSAREAAARKQAVDAALGRASNHIQNGQVEAAVTLLGEALRAYPDSTELRNAAARAQSRREEADRQRETTELAALMESARSEESWNHALERAAAALQRFPGDANLDRLRQKAEEGRQRSEVAKTESAALEALGSGNFLLANEIVTAARSRWPNEKRFRKLQDEVEIKRADEALARAKKLLQEGRHAEAHQQAMQALQHRPKYQAAGTVIEEIAARRAAREAETKRENTAISVPPAVSVHGKPARLGIVAAAAGVVLAAAGSWFFFIRKPAPTPTPAPIGAAVRPENAPEPLKISDAAPPSSASVGNSYSRTLRTRGGIPPVFWSIDEGSLPPGLNLDGASGAISGTPAKSGKFGFIARATDAKGSAARLNLTIGVEASKEPEPVKPIAEARPPQPSPISKPQEKQPKKQDAAPIVASAPAAVARPPETAAPTSPAPCKAKPFSLDEYGDSRSGGLTWNGALAAGAELDIKGRSASSGGVVGEILPPGIPVRVSVSPPSIHLLAAPNAGNCWQSGLRLQNTGPAAVTVTIRWAVYQP